MNNITKYILNILTLSILSVSLLAVFVAIDDYKDFPEKQVIREYVPGKNTYVKWNEKEKVYEVSNYKKAYSELETFPTIEGINFAPYFTDGFRWDLVQDGEGTNDSQDIYIVEFFGRGPYASNDLNFKVKGNENGKTYKEGLKATAKVYSGDEVLTPKDIAKSNSEGNLKIIVSQNFLFKGQEKYYPALKALIAIIPLLLALAYANPYRLRIGKSITLTIVTVVSINLITMIVMHQLNNVAGISHQLLLNNFILINLSLTPAYIKMAYKKRIKR